MQDEGGDSDQTVTAAYAHNVEVVGRVKPLCGCEKPIVVEERSPESRGDRLPHGPFRFELSH